DERKKIAEIKYAALITEKNIPHQTAKEILNLFQNIGKNPNVLKSMTMGRTKCQNIISNVLCPVETERVVNNIQNTRFSIFIDETSDITNEKWMTFLVRYVDSDTLDIRTQLVKLIDIDAKDCSAEKLFKAFELEMTKFQIPFLNIIALSCDNASVITGKHLSFKKNLESKCKNLLTFSCPCHSATLVAHAACAKIPAHCEEFLRKIASYINSSPKRLAVFNEFSECFQDTNRKILKLCDTRWLSHYLCIDRLLELWDSIKYFLNEIVVSEKTKSGEYLLSLMENVNIKAYYLFLKYVLNFFNSFNAFFQAHETRIHILQTKSVNFLVQISEHFLKPDLLKHLLTNLSFHKKENQISLDNVNLGPRYEEYLYKLVKEGHANVVTIIRQNCLQFYITAAEEIRKRLPVNNIFLHKLQVFQPDVALFDKNRESSFNDVSFIAKTLHGFDEDGLKNEWFQLYSDSTIKKTIKKKQNLSTINFDSMWKEILKRQSISNPKYPNLKSLISTIRSLPNSNADPERTFSVLSDIKTKKRNRLSTTTINA
ncbi:Zinc finger protein KIAA0543, partial [Camponotus floridanus]